MSRLNTQLQQYLVAAAVVVLDVKHNKAKALMSCRPTVFFALVCPGNCTLSIGHVENSIFSGSNTNFG